MPATAIEAEIEISVAARAPGRQETPSVAALPFVDMSSEKNQEYFALSPAPRSLP